MAGLRVFCRRRGTVGAVLLAGILVSSCTAPRPLPEALSTSADSSFRYESVFATYRRGHDPGPGSWRALNDEVGRLRGHMGHIENGAAPNGATPGRPN